MNFPSTELESVARIAQEAGRILVDKQPDLKSVRHKQGAGLVTEADHAAEEYIIQALSQKFPGTTFLAEESGTSGEENAMAGRWVIDPLDGTNNYAHGFPWYCVSIGLERNNDIEMGVIYQPVLDELFYAQRGQGSFLNGEPITVSQTERLEDALLTVGFYYHKEDILKREIARFERVHQHALGIRRPGSAALDIAYTACGRLDGYWEIGLSAWDMAAGAVIAREAGARLTKYDGSAFSIHDGEILLTNGRLHTALQKLLVG